MKAYFVSLGLGVSWECVGESFGSAGSLGGRIGSRVLIVVLGSLGVVTVAEDDALVVVNDISSLVSVEELLLPEGLHLVIMIGVLGEASGAGVGTAGGGGSGITGVSGSSTFSSGGSGLTSLEDAGAS